MNAVAQLRNEGREVRAFAARLREICGEDEQAFVDTLDGETEAVEAARRAVRWLNEQAAHEQAMKGLSETYGARAKLYAERQERTRAALLSFMQDLGSTTLPLPEATLTVTKGSATVVGEADADTLPNSLVRVKREPDRAAILAALKAGRGVLGFSLSNAAPRLQVRVK